MRAPIRLALTSLLAAALAAGVPAVPAAGLNDTDALRARARSLAARVSSLEHRLARARAERSRLLGAIDETSRSIAVLDAERLETQERFQQVQQELVARAIEAYKNGPATTLTLLLSTDSLGELYDVAQAAAAAAGSDRDVLNRLLQAKTADERLEARSERRKAILVAERRELEQTIARMRRLLTGRRQALGALYERVDALERAARQAAAARPNPARALRDILSGGGPASGIPAAFSPTGVAFEGVASWYGPGLEGNPTASGQIFDPDLYTAASRDLPLGSWLYVTHAGRGVVVRVNDRGPYVGDRVVDLSRAAARSIGITGLGWVSCEVLVRTG